jgi:hypothetical protein
MYDLDDPDFSRKRTVSEIIIHPGYDALTYENDIALLRLTIPVNLAQPIALNESPANEQVGTEATVVGWGALNNVPNYPTILQELDLEIADNAIATLDLETYVPDEVIVSLIKPDGKDVCFGDSGGPLIVGSGSNLRQIGLLSTGTGEDCGVVGEYSVYTRVSSFTGWVDNVLANRFTEGIRGIWAVSPSAGSTTDPVRGLDYYASEADVVVFPADGEFRIRATSTDFTPYLYVLDASDTVVAASNYNGTDAVLDVEGAVGQELTLYISSLEPERFGSVSLVTRPLSSLADFVASMEAGTHVSGEITQSDEVATDIFRDVIKLDNLAGGATYTVQLYSDFTTTGNDFWLTVYDQEGHVIEIDTEPSELKAFTFSVPQQPDPDAFYINVENALLSDFTGTYTTRLTLGTNVADSDNDGLQAAVEMSTYLTNPLLFDTDGDGQGDGTEILRFQTDPLDPASFFKTKVKIDSFNTATSQVTIRFDSVAQATYQFYLSSNLVDWSYALQGEAVQRVTATGSSTTATVQGATGPRLFLIVQPR